MTKNHLFIDPCALRSCARPYKSYCVLQLKCKCGPLWNNSRREQAGWVDSLWLRRAFSSQRLMESGEFSPQVNLGCYCPGLAGGTQPPTTTPLPPPPPPLVIPLTRGRAGFMAVVRSRQTRGADEGGKRPIQLGWLQRLWGF